MIGDLKINNIDAFERYGINIEDGAISTLMTPAPMKGFIENKSRLRHGKVVLTKYPRYDEREITLPFHLIAKTKEDFFQKYHLFCEEVLSKGRIELITKYEPNVVYRLDYLSCTQFRQFIREMAVFSLKVSEPDPTNRGITDKYAQVDTQDS